jgi:hypothetical protein
MNRTAFSTVQNDTWGSDVAFDPAAFPMTCGGDMIRQFRPDPGSSNSNLLTTFTFDFLQARNIAASSWRGPLRAHWGLLHDRSSRQEESQSAYVQFSQAFDTAMPIHAAVGVRYEYTLDVTSSARTVTGRYLWAR